MQERRKHPRINKKLPIKILAQRKDLLVTRTENISASGAYCSTNKYIEPMTILEIVMLLPHHIPGKKDHKITCKGVVVRTEKAPANNGKESYNIAIFFNEFRGKEKERLQEYIEKHLVNS